ncbi:RidA family protein [Bacillus sp. CH30_1T]|uniref:RidA family protein n=1 Tax=Bacillus sp. CH30_1T TaxID=2604836 RepID=UPI0011EED1EC|nr:RidA family protein [Bacillus sp. CH30_1T]KAA0566664.1 RidA family protein [Bacillus sp. CH30_1T]
MNKKISLIRSTQLADVDYAYAARVPSDRDLLFLAGACPLNKEGEVPHINDYELQAKLCVENMKEVLKESSASLKDVVYTRVLVASQHQSDLVTAWNAIRKEFGDHDVPSTLSGVTVLGYTHQLVEIEAIAAVGKGTNVK